MKKFNLLFVLLVILMACSEGEAEKDLIVKVTSIKLSQSTLNLKIGDEATLTATVAPPNATNKTVAWTSSDANVATVAKGIVTAKGEGSATIRAAVESQVATCTVTVTKGSVAVETITLSAETLTLEEGKTATLTATVTPDDATDKQVTWATSDASVATVSEGTVTAVKAGTAEITASAGGKTAKCTVTVNQKVVAVTSVTLSQSMLTLEEGKTATLTATVLPNNATDKTVTWTTSNAGVATVSSTGTVTAVKAGTAEITASAGGKTAKCTVTVKKKVEGGVDPSINPWEDDGEDYGGTVN